MVDDESSVVSPDPEPGKQSSSSQGFRSPCPGARCGGLVVGGGRVGGI